MTTVTQADREAAADYYRVASPIAKCPSFRLALRSGLHDDDALVQAFARHRQSDTNTNVVEALRTAAQALADRASDTYRKGNGQIRSIEADDGEKCWIVHDDDMHHLRAALASLSQPTTPASVVEAIWRSIKRAMFKDAGPEYDEIARSCIEPHLSALSTDRRDALEEAAKVAETRGEIKNGCTTRSAVCTEVAQAIRALADKEPQS